MNKRQWKKRLKQARTALGLISKAASEVTLEIKGRKIVASVDTETVHVPLWEHQRKAIENVYLVKNAIVQAQNIPAPIKEFDR